MQKLCTCTCVATEMQKNVLKLQGLCYVNKTILHSACMRHNGTKETATIATEEEQNR